MREVEQWVGRECLTLDFVKCWFRLYGCCLWYKLNITVFYQLHGGKVLFSFKTIRLVYKGFAVEFHFGWATILTALFWNIEIYGGKICRWNCIEKVRIN